MPEPGGLPAPEQREEQRSSVKLVRNAKGDTQIEVKVYAGDTEQDVDRARDLAVRTYRELNTNFAGEKAA
jgi:hypothetical protein